MSIIIYVLSVYHHMLEDMLSGISFFLQISLLLVYIGKFAEMWFSFLGFVMCLGYIVNVPTFSGKCCGLLCMLFSYVFHIYNQTVAMYKFRLLAYLASMLHTVYVFRFEPNSPIWTNRHQQYLSAKSDGEQESCLPI